MKLKAQPFRGSSEPAIDPRNVFPDQFRNGKIIGTSINTLAAFGTGPGPFDGVDNCFHSLPFINALNRNASETEPIDFDSRFSKHNPSHHDSFRRLRVYDVRTGWPPHPPV
jgi:hypothetical protein